MSTPCQPGIAEKFAGAEPLPGYRLLRPLGKGGFGEVWKCEAPGGLPKAIKFVPAGGDQFRQEQAAVEQIRTIRHPFLLTLERVELTGGELVMVMELADCQLNDRLHKCRAQGLAGIPRDELIGYLREAAEALDLIAGRFGLQHLDVKPENLFLVAGHLKVGDYGLVRRTQRVAPDSDTGRGFTPRYTPPEVLHGAVHPRSDQYSLALVYAELLTGTFPYSGKSAQQLMIQHLNTAPTLTALPPGDRPVVARALAKEPADRFPSCLAFMRALGGSSDVVPVSAERAYPVADLPDPPVANPTPNQTETPTVPYRGPVTTPDQERPPLPPAPPPAVFGDAAQAPSREIVLPRRPAGRPNRRAEPPPPANPFAGLRPVMWVDQFNRPPAEADAPQGLNPPEYVSAVLRAAAGEGPEVGVDGMTPNPTPPCRFLSTLPAAMVPLKLALVAEHWGMVVQQPGPTRVVLWREAPVIEPKKPGKPEPPPPGPPPGFQVSVRRPTPPAAEYTAAGSLVGSPQLVFTCQAWADLPAILAEIRGQLQNLDERRAHPRHPVALPVRVYPLYEDGVIGPAVAGETVDISVGGIRFRTPEPVRTARLYVEFPAVREAAGQAVYVRQLRAGQEPGGRATVTAGRFAGGG